MSSSHSPSVRQWSEHRPTGMSLDQTLGSVKREASPVGRTSLFLLLGQAPSAGMDRGACLQSIFAHGLWGVGCSCWAAILGIETGSGRSRGVERSSHSAGRVAGG